MIGAGSGHNCGKPSKYSMPAASISQPNSSCQAAAAKVGARMSAHFK